MMQVIKNLIRLYKVARKAKEIYKILKSCNKDYVTKMKFHAITLDDWSINYSELVGTEEVRLNLYEGYISVSKDYKCIFLHSIFYVGNALICLCTLRHFHLSYP